MKMEINLYREAVALAATTKLDSRFSNKGSDHAKVVMQYIFRSADNCVRWYSGRIASDFLLSHELKNAVTDYLNKDGSKLIIIAEKKADPESLIFLQLFKSKVEIHFLSELDLKPKISLPGHFIVADDISFRLETNDATREAIVNFNEPAIARRLITLFDNVIDQEFTKQS
jgi:hypothetical protein